MATQISVQPIDNGVQISVTGRKVDAKMLQDCLNAALECDDSTGCLTGGIDLKDGCFKTVSRHDAAANCLSSGLGLSPA